MTTPGARGPHSGPVFLLTSEPIEGDIVNEPSKTPMPSKLGLFIGLPVMFGFVVAMVCGTHFCMRRQRQIGPIVIGGGGKRFKKGYTGREARRSRARQAGGVATYRDEDEDAAEVGMAAPVPKPKSEWELTSVKGGRDSLQ